MEFEILRNKKSTNGKIDMLSNVLLIDYAKINIAEWILIDEFTAMGIDYIAEKMYGSADYAWVLIKFNRISNPLTINIGDVIACPDINDFRQNSKWIEYSKTTSNSMSYQNTQFKKMKSSSSAVKSISSSNFVKKSGNVIF